MSIKRLLFLTLALVNCAKSIEVLWAYHKASAIVAANLLDGIFTAVSDNEILICRQGVLSLWNSSGVISKIRLNRQPDKIYAHEVTEEEIIHIVMSTYTNEQSSTNEVTYCAYYYAYERFSCRGNNRYTLPTATDQFAASLLTTDHGQAYAYAVYITNDYLTRYDVIDHQERHHVSPRDCSSSNITLIPVDEPKGRVIVQCDGGNTYLHDLYSGNFFVLPPDARRVATSKYRELMLATQPSKGLHQDLIVEVNMATELDNSSVLPLEGLLANSSNPVLIPDVAIVVVNETSQSEIGYFLRHGELLYFELAELEIHPKLQSLSLPLEIVAIRGTYNSSIVVEGTSSNGTIVLIVIEAFKQQRSENLSTNETDESIEPTSMNRTMVNNQSETITPQPSPSHTILCTQTDRNTKTSTRPHQTDEPSFNNEQAESSSASNDSHKFDIVSYIYGLVTGLVFTLACVVPLAILLYRLKKSNGFINV